MNIRQLEAFRAIMLARSTVGAADLLQMSQPAVSRLLSQLEASLKLTLFDRTSGRLVPTPEALLLYSEVERTFVSVDKIREMAREIRSAEAGALTIASLPLLALGFLPNAMRRFNETHPRTRLSLNVEMSPEVEKLAAPIARAWRKDGPASRVAGSAFFKWVANTTWTAPVTDRDLLDFALSRGVIGV